ncbi:hypothetical protein Ct9H90mP29_16660 [bacterium]|nr:MAG: hypothetical protein Ct9H90mP29_16660 [bacterium]
MVKQLQMQKAVYYVELRVVEYATSLPNVLKGESSDVSEGINCTMTHEPLGVVAGITPFNFPIMVPLWMIPLAITAGNTLSLNHRSRHHYPVCVLLNI